MLKTVLILRTNVTRQLAGVSCISIRSKHTLPDLKYDFNALEPYISADIMKIHYEKHHQTYVTNLNIAEEKLAEAQAKGDIKTIISLAPALRFNGGGHLNHSIFWQNLGPKTAEAPTGELKAAIDRDFGSFENLKNQLSTASVAVQGSGWGWLGFNKQTGRLQVASCPNQDPLETSTGLIPLFGIDVWEHAYYLQYKNMRADYVKAIWNVANWKDIADRLAKAKG
jgi:Fe-Mn family superoxide dismutase